MKKYLILILSATLIYPKLSIAAPNRLTCPIEPPAGLTGQTISESIVVNGLPTAIRQVNGSKSAEATITQTELEWKSRGYFPIRNKDNHWLIISASTDKCTSVLQLFKDSIAEGFFSISYPNEIKDILDKKTIALLPKNSIIESTTQTKDSGRDGLTIILQSKNKSSKWAEELMSNLRENQWGKIEIQILLLPTGDNLKITAQLGKKQITAIAWGEYQTNSVILIVDAL